MAKKVKRGTLIQNSSLILTMGGKSLQGYYIGHVPECSHLSLL